MESDGRQGELPSIEELLMMLDAKDQDLMLAAGFGQTLLKENGNLKQENAALRIQLEEVSIGTFSHFFDLHTNVFLIPTSQVLHRTFDDQYTQHSSNELIDFERNQKGSV